MDMKELILEYINNHVKKNITTKRIGKLYGLTPTEMYCYLDILRKENNIELVEPTKTQDIPNYRWRKTIKTE